MISKEKKAAIMKEYARTVRRYRITGSTGSSSYSKNSGTYRAFTEQP